MKHLKSLLSKYYMKSYGRLIIVVLASIIIGASIINIRYHILSHLIDTSKPIVSTVNSQNNNWPAICVVGEAGCATLQNSATLTTSSQTSQPSSVSSTVLPESTNTSQTSNSSTPPPQTQTKSASCSQAQAWYGPVYTAAVNSSYNGWPSFETTAEINYEGNQLVQKAYNTYSQTMEIFGCKPQLNLVLKSPSTKPNYNITSPSSSPSPIITTCNTTQATNYEADYNSQYGIDQQNEQAQISAIQTQDGGTSAESLLISGVETQFNLTIQELQSKTNQQLASIDCPAMNF